MADRTRIEWADATWNPVAGCTRVSPGCERCYIDWAPPFRVEGRHFVDAAGQRSNAIGSSTGVRLHPERLDQPIRWRRPRRIFVCSLADLFHDQVPDAYIARVWAVMALARQHTFQVLTKRPARMRALLSSGLFQRWVEEHASTEAGRIVNCPWPLPNVWVGVTAEDQPRADQRVPILMETPAAVRFLSCEPLLGPVALSRLHAYCPTHDFAGGFCTGGCPDVRIPNWVIVGGESGPGARPMHPDWARALRDQCQGLRVPFLFKQWGEWLPLEARQHLDLPSQQREWRSLGDCVTVRVGKRAAGRELDGHTWDQYPAGEPS